MLVVGVDVVVGVVVDAIVGYVSKVPDVLSGGVDVSTDVVLLCAEVDNVLVDVVGGVVIDAVVGYVSKVPDVLAVSVVVTATLVVGSDVVDDTSPDPSSSVVVVTTLVTTVPADVLSGTLDDGSVA